MQKSMKRKLLIAAGLALSFTANAAEPVVGEMIYWVDGDVITASVLKYGQAKENRLAAPQSELALKGILITRIELPGCGIVKFRRDELGSHYGTATAEEAARFPDCPIADWKGTWRMGRLF